MTVNGLHLRLPQRQKLALIFVPLAIVLLLALGIGFHQQIKNQLNAWKLLPEPEKLTELYFTKPNNLPTTYAPGQVQTVSFTAHNIEYQPETYRYEIVEQSADASKSQVLTTGSFLLQQNQYEHESLNVTPVNLGTRAQITVVLPTVNETISYWVEASGE